MAALLCSAAAQAGAIYRWVDEQGKTHFSDVVPEKYRRVAKPVGTTDEGAPPAQAAPPAPASRPASAPVARAASAPAAAPADSMRRPPPASAPAPGKRPATTPTAGTDCETWQRLYRESIDCFAPFVTVRGAVKAEAFEVCNPVPEPPIRCGRMAQ